MTSKPHISFVICTYNPNRDYLRRTVESILSQSGDSEFEVLVVDNRSTPPVRTEELPEGARLRIVVEDIPGLTPARLRGALEAGADLLVYADDDNLLASNYAATALRLATERPDIGVFSARITGAFERSPDPWMSSYLSFLAINPIVEDRYSHDPAGGTMPIGAGMVVRKKVMERYAATVQSDPLRRAMDRDGSSLLAGGDTDIGHAAMSLGLGCGWCKDLNVEHIIPECRLAPEYLSRLVRDVTASHIVLQRIHGGRPPSAWRRFKWALLASVGPLLPKESPLRTRSAIAAGKSKGEAIYKRALKRFSEVS